MPFSLPITQKVTLSLPPVLDTDGNPIPLDPNKVPTWTITRRDGNPTAAAGIFPGQAGLAALLIPAASLVGSRTVTVMATAYPDPATGQDPISFSVDVNIIGTSISPGGGLQIGTPVPR